MVPSERTCLGELDQVSHLDSIHKAVQELTRYDGNRPRLEGISDRFADKPLIGFVSTLIKDYTPLIDDYYYCTLAPAKILFERFRQLNFLLFSQIPLKLAISSHRTLHITSVSLPLPRNPVCQCAVLFGCSVGFSQSSNIVSFLFSSLPNLPLARIVMRCKY